MNKTIKSANILMYLLMLLSVIFSIIDVVEVKYQTNLNLENIDGLLNSLTLSYKTYDNDIIKKVSLNSYDLNNDTLINIDL